MSASEFIYCEGCGARLDPQDRSCPKCGHPAPGILSAESSAHDLAAGKTASFPKLSQEAIEHAIPAPTLDPFAPAGSSFDSQATDVLDGAALRRAAADRNQGRTAAYQDPQPAEVADAPAKPRRGMRRVAVGAVIVLVAVCAALFVLIDPLQVMPGVYATFEQAASDAFPTRQEPEEGVEQPAAQDDADAPASPDLSDATLSEDAAYDRLTEIYNTILVFQDDLAPVVESYNGYYKAYDVALRKQNAQKAYDLRDRITQTKEELSSLNLAQDSAYLGDVEHLHQLATWMYNRVDVLCRSWDVSLEVPEGHYPSEREDEILAPLRNVEKVDGTAVDVLEYERNVGAWKPRRK